MSYNATAVLENITSSKNLTTIIAIENQVVLNGWLGIMIWLMLVCVSFLTLKSRGATSSGSASASIFFGFVLSLFLTSLNLVPSWFLYINVILLALVGVIITLNRT